MGLKAFWAHQASAFQRVFETANVLVLRLLSHCLRYRPAKVGESEVVEVAESKACNTVPPALPADSDQSGISDPFKNFEGCFEDQKFAYKKL